MVHPIIGLRRATPEWRLIGLILVSLVFLCFQFGPFGGTIPALFLSAALQVGLTGYLLSRALGILNSSEPITFVLTTVIAGLMSLIVLGAVFRFLGIPLLLFIITIHTLMLILSCFPARTNRWPPKRTKGRWFAYLTVVICIVVMEVFGGAESQFRFSGELSDRGLFASMTEGLVEGGSATGQYTRVIGQSSDFRLEIDGWTYMSASWVYGSGFPAYVYLWYIQTPLLVWIIPAALFALTYLLTNSEWAATTVVIVLTVFAIQTYDVAFFNNFPTASGRHPLFDLRTLRELSQAVLLPLTLVAWVTYLRQRRWQWLMIVGVSLLALASAHPTALLVLVLIITISSLVTIATARKLLVRKRTLAVLGFLIVLVIVAGILIIRTRLPEFFSTSPQVTSCTLPQIPPATQAMIHIFEMPTVGLTYILMPSLPVVTIVLLSSIYLAVIWRRRIVASFFVAPAIMTAGVIVSPILIKALSNMLSLNLLIGDTCQLGNPLVVNLIANLLETTMNVVIFVLIGCSLWSLLRHWFWLKKHARIVYPVVTTGFLFLTLFEPIPIPDSARDQLRTMQDMLAPLTIQPSDAQFASELRGVLKGSAIQIILAPPSLAETILEQVPNTLVVTEATGVYQSQAARFFGDAKLVTPLLDAADIAFLRETKVNDVVLSLFDTRYPQFLLDPSRFELVYTADSYAMFKVKPLDQPIASDLLFAQENQIFSQHYVSAWQHSGMAEFPFVSFSDPGALRSAWNELPASPLRDYGLALLDTMSRNFAAAAPLWESLHAEYPIFVDALALSWDQSNRGTDAVSTLLNALSLPDPGAQLTAARALLTERYFYRLSTDDIQHVLRVISAHESDWRKLTGDEPSVSFQQRIELLMSRSFWSTAANWLSWIPSRDISAKDYTMRGLALLAQGDVAGSLDELGSATDSDWLIPRVRLHPDRWTVNVAAQTYDMLKGNLAEQSGNLDVARSFYARAVSDGATWAGQYFLAHLNNDAQQMMNLQSEWRQTFGTPFPEFVPLLTIAQTGSIYVNQPEVIRNSSETSFQIAVTYGAAFEQQYPVEAWRIDLRSPDAQIIYAQAEQKAYFVSGTLLRLSQTVNLDPSLPKLTPARIFIQPRHNNAIILGEEDTPVVLQRPAETEIPTNATPINTRFGAAIILKSYRLTINPNEIQVSLYWQADQPIGQDYHVALLVLNSADEIALQDDSAPVNGQYPTHQWRLNTTIEDDYLLPITTPLKPDHYRIGLAVYSTADNSRLPVGNSNLLILGSFDR